MNAPVPALYMSDWLGPEECFLRPVLPKPPTIPLEDVFGDRWARRICQAAEGEASPPDYVAAALLSVAGSFIGNARWIFALGRLG